MAGARSAAARLRPALAVGILVVALWTLVALVREAESRHRLYEAAAERAVPASAWQLQSPQVRRLEHFLHRATVSIPEGKIVGFTAPRGQGGQGDQDFFAHLWAAYLLPHHHVILGRSGGAGRWAEYWIDFRPPQQPPAAPRGELLLHHRLGNVYRVTPGPTP